MASDFARLNEQADKTIYTPGRWSDPMDRQLIGWPLPEVELDVPATADDFLPGGRWPGDNARDAIQRLNLYWRLYRGDITPFVKDGTIVRLLPNYFARVADGQAAMMVSNSPPPLIQQTAANAVVDMVRYGRAYIVNNDGELHTFDPRFCATDEAGQTLWVISPFVSADSQDGLYDRATVYVIDNGRGDDAEGGLVSYDIELGSAQRKGDTFQFTIRSMGDETEPVPGGWAYADQHPSIDGWGKSSFDDMIPFCFEIAKRLTTNSRIMDEHLDLTLLLAGNQDDIQRAIINDSAIDSEGWTKRDTQYAMQRAVLTTPVLSAGDGVNVRDTGYLTWDGQLTSSFSQLELLKGELRLLPGVATVLEMEAGDAPSGRAMREMTASDREHGNLIHNELVMALSEALGFDVDWASPFTRPDTDADLPADDDGDGPGAT